MNYKSLDVWIMAMDLVVEVYNVTKSYLRDEIYALTSQTKRAAASVPANIAEGVGRNYKKDTVQFLHIARGSLYELETLLQIALRTAILPDEHFNKINLQIERCLQVLNGFINYYEKSNLK
jgi:four helix bundle protein